MDKPKSTLTKYMIVEDYLEYDDTYYTVNSDAVGYIHNTIYDTKEEAENFIDTYIRKTTTKLWEYNYYSYSYHLSDENETLNNINDILGTSFSNLEDVVIEFSTDEQYERFKEECEELYEFLNIYRVIRVKVPNNDPLENDYNTLSNILESSQYLEDLQDNMIKPISDNKEKLHNEFTEVILQQLDLPDYIKSFGWKQYVDTTFKVDLDSISINDIENSIDDASLISLVMDKENLYKEEAKDHIYDIIYDIKEAINKFPKAALKILFGDNQDVRIVNKNYNE